jgi:hypothetical protein
MKKRPQIDHAAERTEGMPIGLTDARPIGEPDAELVGRLGMANEVAFVDIEKAQQVHDRRNGRFADAHRSDVRRLDHRDDGTGARQRSRQDARGHPTGSAAADDRDASDLQVIRHCPEPRNQKAPARLPTSRPPSRDGRHLQSTITPTRVGVVVRT